MANSSNLPNSLGIQHYGLLLREGGVNFTVIIFKERVVSRQSVTAVVPALQINFRLGNLKMLKSQRWHTAVARLSCTEYLTYKLSWFSLCSLQSLFEHNIITLCTKRLIKCFTYSFNISQFPNLYLKISWQVLSLRLKIKTKTFTN